MIFVFFSLLLVLLVLLTTDGYGGADSFQHYMISRFSWKHPKLFLDHWGKPVFTLLTSPFSQFGYKGLLVFNVLASLLSAWFVYKLSVKLKSENPALSIFFYLAMPMVILTSVSALTEPLFALFLVASVWLFSEKKYTLSILLLSFLPLVRSEGFVVFPVFFVALMLNRKWVHALLFPFGILVYSIVGYFVFDDFLWLLHQSPYKMETGIYGSGPWYHFMRNSWFIFSTPITILGLVGVIYYIPQNINWLKNETNILKLLIAGSFVAYFAAHSYVWWKGTGGSLGLERVIAGVCPLAAIIALSGYNYLSRILKKMIVSPLWFQLLIFIFVIKSCIDVIRGNLQQGVEQKLMTDAAQWIKSQPGMVDQRIFYFNPHITFLLDKDIFDSEKVHQLWGIVDENEPLLWLRDDHYLVWDAHFGSNEGQSPIEKLLHKKDVKILKRFYPEEQFKVMGGYNYEIFILGKESGWNDSLVTVEPDSGSIFSGLIDKKFDVKNSDEFINVFEEDLHAFSNSEVVYLEINLKFPEGKLPNKDALLFVLDTKCNGNTLVYDVADLGSANNENGSLTLSKKHLLPPITDECGIVKSYFWNREKTELNGIDVGVKLIHVPAYQ